MSMCFDRHERDMINQQQQEDGRWNWYGFAEDKDELTEYEKKYGQDGTAANNMVFENLARTAKVKKNYEL